MALHFVGFVHPAIAGDTRYEYAVRIFGKPDFVHRRWDVRASAEVAPGDVVLFAEGNEHVPPAIHAYDDSAMQ